MFCKFTTKTATFNGAALFLLGRPPRRGLKCRISDSAAANASSGSGGATFSIDICYDGVPTVWNVDSCYAQLPLLLFCSRGRVFIPFSISPTSVANGKSRADVQHRRSGAPKKPTEIPPPSLQEVAVRSPNGMEE